MADCLKIQAAALFPSVRCRVTGAFAAAALHQQQLDKQDKKIDGISPGKDFDSELVETLKTFPPSVLTVYEHKRDSLVHIMQNYASPGDKNFLEKEAVQKFKSEWRREDDTYTPGLHGLIDSLLVKDGRVDILLAAAIYAWSTKDSEGHYEEKVLKPAYQFFVRITPPAKPDPDRR